MIRISALFSDNMVMQRDRPLPVWGWTEPGKKVEASIGKNTAKGVAGADGKFVVMLAPMPAGGPYELIVKGSSRVIVRNVMLGEVWICSGQSNMQWPVNNSANAAAEVAAAACPGIRLFSVPRLALIERQADIAAKWQECSPDTVKDFSAVGYFFGRELHRRLGVPVGLINSSWGGTRIEAWISRESLMTDPPCRKMVERYETFLASPEREQIVAKIASLPADPLERERLLVHPDPGNLGFGQGWAAPGFDDSAWPSINLPAAWQQIGHDFSGVFWFRREVNIPSAWAGKDLILSVGACDKHDTTYFNNEHIGSIGFENTNAWCTTRRYTIPGRLARPGRNVVAVRVYSFRNQGGMIGPENDMWMAPAANAAAVKIPLTGPWRYQIEHNFGVIVSASTPFGPGNPNSPHILFDSMINPLLPFALRGFIWYQGESNAGSARYYRSQMPLMIRDWRKAWGSDNLCFLLVQLANYKAVMDEPSKSTWAELREAQLMALSEPDTGMAVAIDIGDANDIHPKNKQEAGRRLSLAALAKAYGEDIVYSGPIIESWNIEGDTIRLRFKHIGGGLTSVGGAPLKGFAVAGNDRVFHWAEAVIAGDTILVRSKDVPRPVAARYAWADNPVCNFINKEKLPASPFRTDNWPG